MANCLTVNGNCLTQQKKRKYLNFTSNIYVRDIQVSMHSCLPSEQRIFAFYHLLQISRVSRIVAASGNLELMNGIIRQLQDKFAQSEKWFERQA